MTKKKCKKYQKLYIFASEEELNEHINICPDCKKEHEDMQKISSMVKEVKPFIKYTEKNPNRKINIYKHAAVFLGLIALISIVGINLNIVNVSNKPIDTNLTNLDVDLENSVIAQMGLPVDDYGLLRIE